MPGECAHVPWLPPHVRSSPPLQEAALLLLGGLTFSMEAILRVLLRSAVEPRLSESVRAEP